MDRQLSERALIALLALVQFVNIVDFMMVMPLGPDFARALGIDPSNIGLLGGAYTLAAAVTGVLGVRFLDRFGRRAALSVSLFGLGLGTLAAALADSLAGLVVARLVAGAFGGPATSLSLAIVADVVPPERRGRAMGAVMGSFPFAAVLGVPAGLELARIGSWHTPFVALGLLILVTALVAWRTLPALRSHLDHVAVPGALRALLVSPLARLAYTAMGLAMFSRFLVVPNLSTWLQFNLGYPREDIGLLYLWGGVASFFTLRAAGIAVDRFGALPTAWTAATLFTVVLGAGFLPAEPWLAPAWVFGIFMVSASAGSVANSTTISKVPGPRERAGFMAANSAVQHLACSAGALLSTGLLSAARDGALIGLSSVAGLALALGLLQPWVLGRVERGLGKPH